MALTAGDRLGPYEVTAELGKGGMGEVYRATDTKLKREVAIKILPESFAADPERLARFRREAEVLASLNHPNIAAIYGLEDSGTTHALVLELVDGPTLADRISQGAIPLEEALPIARQIAEALEAAHEQGIVHRDLKPANIKIQGAWGPTPTRGTPAASSVASRPRVTDGTVKVLDFGLAKALTDVRSAGASAPAADAAESPTMSMTAAATRAGFILGTAAYMSPEQARGKPVDRRTDIWAFGVVLYEMLTGRQGFGGTDISETLASVLKTDLDLEALPSDTPSTIRTLLRRCLQRDPRKRLPHIGSARLELTDAIDSPDSPDRPSASPRRAVILVGAGVLAGAVLALGASGLWSGERSPGLSEPIRFEVFAPGDERFPEFRSANLRLSPDGRRLAFITRSRRDSSRRIVVRPLDSMDAQVVPGTVGARNFSWSPDGTSIAFTDERYALRLVESAGGPLRTLAETVGEVGAWSEQGEILYRGQDGLIYRVSVAGGVAEPLTAVDFETGEVQHTPEFFLPDGRRFVFRVRNRDPARSVVVLGALDSPSRTVVLDGLADVDFTDGFLVYQRDGTLMAQPFDENAGQVRGPAMSVAEGLEYDTTNSSKAFSVSRNGVLAYRAMVGGGTSTLTWFDRSGQPLDTVRDFIEFFFDRPSLSSDGRRLAVSTREATSGTADLWLIDLDRGVPSRFTFDSAMDDTPLFSPDGGRVVFRSTRSGGGDLYERASGGVADASLLLETTTASRPWSFRPDGSVLLFSSPMTSAGDIWALPMQSDEQPYSVVATGFPAGYAVFSPDGRWFAYCEGDSGGDQVYVQPFPQDGTRIRMSNPEGSSPSWVGNELFYVGGDHRVMVVDVTDPRQPGSPRELFVASSTFEHRSVLVDPSGQRFLLPVPTDAQEEPSISVVVNWLDELRARVSAQ